MSSSVNRRLDRLATLYQTRGCAECRGWSPVMVEIVQISEDSDPDPAPRRPPRCPTCGRVVPPPVVVQIIAPDPDDQNAGIVGE